MNTMENMDETFERFVFFRKPAGVTDNAKDNLGDQGGDVGG